MGEIKDKIVSLEVLNAAYDANKQKINKLYEQAAKLKTEIADKATLENGVIKFWKTSTEESGTDTLLYSVDISSIGGTGGLDLENLTLSVSQVGNYQRLSMSDGTTSKTVDIPITVITDEQVQTAVTEYLNVNPVQAGATAEEAEQIQKNTDNISKFNEKISNIEDDIYSTDEIPRFVRKYLEHSENEELGKTYFILDGLSEKDGEFNRALIQNALDTYDYIILKRGIYPLKPTVSIDGKTLDLNFSKIQSTEYKVPEVLFELKGIHPVLKNGEVCANYDKLENEEGYSFYENEGLVGGKSFSYENAVVDNLDLHNCWGYAIRETKFEGVRGNGSSYSIEKTEPFNDTLNAYTSSKINLTEGYKYVCAHDGVGYNRIISAIPVKYSFYNENDELLGTEKQIPFIPVLIPENSKKFTVTSYLKEFKPYVWTLTNYRGGFSVKNCKIHNNSSLAITGTAGVMYIYNVYSYGQARPREDGSNTQRSTTGMLDIEDVPTPVLYMLNCKSEPDDGMNGCMIGAYLAQIDGFKKDFLRGITIYRGWKAIAKNCNAVFNTYSKDTDVVMIGYKNVYPRAHNIFDNGKLVESECTYMSCSRDNMESSYNFKILFPEAVYAGVSLNGLLKGELRGPGIPIRYSKISPSRGSELKIYRSDNVVGYITFLSADSWGITSNFPLYGNVKIHDTIFNIDYPYTYDESLYSCTAFETTYINCILNLDAGSFYKLTKKAHEIFRGLTIRYKDCTINNENHHLFAENMEKYDTTLIFINCSIADKTKIYPDMKDSDLVTIKYYDNYEDYLNDNGEEID